jgi:peptidoglycan hydrolase-like protein with peptidoglycan-binding domain
MEQAFRTQSRFIRQQLQAKLQEKGFYQSYVDGAWGPGTRNAFDSFAMSVNKTHLLTSYTGASEIMRMLLSEDEVEQLSVVDESTQVGTAENIDDALEGSSAQPAQDPEAVKQKLKIADEQLSLLNEVLRIQVMENGSDEFAKDKIKAVKARISVIEAFKGQSVSDADATVGAPTMPVSLSAAKVARIFPLIPYYTPGSGQVGELQVAPRATGKGVVYDFNFIQHATGTEDISSTISINSADIEQLNYGIKKSHEWSSVAKKKGLRQLHQKAASCFPENMCDDGGSGSPTKVMFMLYEDGSTAAKIQQKSGNTIIGYNLADEAALLLSSYLDFMQSKGEAEFSVGTMTDADLNNVFK